MSAPRFPNRGPRVAVARDSVALVCAFIAFALGCAAQQHPQEDDLAGVGQTHASVDPLAGTHPVVDSSQPASVVERALLLVAMRQALETATSSDRLEGVLRGDVVPIVTVDPGLRSAQLTVFAVRKRGRKLDQLRADRVAIASMMLLDGPRVVDVQRIRGPVEAEERAAVAAWLAARDLVGSAEDARPDLLVVPETDGSSVVHRVYAWSSAPSPGSAAADREVRVEWTAKGRPVTEVFDRPLPVRNSASSLQLDALHPLPLARLFADADAWQWPVRIRTPRSEIALHREGRVTTAALDENH